jgi:hypothetical protein
MREIPRRRSSIAIELIRSADALSRVLVRIDEVLKLPEITLARATDIESIADTIGDVFLGIRQAATANDLDRLIACGDRLREEIAIAEALLYRFIKPIN